MYGCKARSIWDRTRNRNRMSALVKGSRASYKKRHPKTAVLIVEVSDTTLKNDRIRKASLYARAGIADYWIINLVDRQLEVYRQPAAGYGADLWTWLRRHDIFERWGEPSARWRRLAVSFGVAGIVALMTWAG